MFKVLIFSFIFSMFPVAYAAGDMVVEETHIHIEKGVVYCDVQTFNQEAYILKVIGSGSPMTVFWQFEVLQARHYWLDKSVVSIRLGRQVIPDLVTQRWLMRDLSGGVVKYTNDAEEAMHFLTQMQHAAVVDVSVLSEAMNYTLETKLFTYEGENEDESWWGSITDWGESMGSVNLQLPLADNNEQK